MLRDRETAQAALAEFEPIFFEIVREALRAYLRDYGEHRHRHTARTEANIIHDLMRGEARRRFRDHRRVKLIDRGNHFHICVDGEYVIKLKKMGPGLTTCNYPTQAALDFVNQSVQLTLPGVAGEATNLHLGYQKREIELLSSPVYITCPYDGKVAWEWMLAEPVEIVEVPELPAETSIPRRRVTPKVGTDAREQTISDQKESEQLDEKRNAEG